jgi:hypothetical protein
VQQLHLPSVQQPHLPDQPSLLVHSVRLRRQQQPHLLEKPLEQPPFSLASYKKKSTRRPSSMLRVMAIQ